MKSYFLGLFLLISIVLIGCEHTLQGFGEDMQQTGKKIQDSAKTS